MHRMHSNAHEPTVHMHRCAKNRITFQSTAASHAQIISVNLSKDDPSWQAGKSIITNTLSSYALFLRSPSQGGSPSVADCGPKVTQASPHNQFINACYRRDYKNIKFMAINQMEYWHMEQA